ncbi:MAG TPA: aminotransferase class V-fold PLP-dependent enzyme [Candidatus Nitrosopolaris sp.]|nr:aminotransferase class V-fold PLP-dependent enzyme [Candidatus Nitrosopolaris sp.]
MNYEGLRIDGRSDKFHPNDIIESDSIRRDFPVTLRKVYMNNGAIAPTPLSTIKSITDFLVKSSEGGPGSTFISEYITTLMKELRTRISHLINCEPEDIIFTQSTTEGLNYVSSGINWNRKAADSIIVRGGTHEHYANYLPWLHVSKRKGIKLHELKIDENGYFELEELEALLKKKTNNGNHKNKSNSGSTTLVTLSHALYNNGSIMPVTDVGKIARENQALFCLDAAQTVGSICVDVKRIGCDFMAFPAFKWICGPVGMGIFYCSKKAAEFLVPHFIGGESATFSVDENQKQKNVITFADGPERFQAGFRNYSGVAGMESSVRYILRLGIENIRRKNLKIANVLRDELTKIPNIKIHGPDDENLRTSIVSFSPSPSSIVDSRTIVNKLEQNEIIFAERDIGGGMKSVRAAPHFFNTEEEAVRAASYLKDILK